MKFKQFALLYGLTFLFFLILACFVPEREVYWMHDASFEFSRKWAFLHAAYSFLLPLCLQFIIHKFQEAHSAQLFKFHYSFAMLSVLLLCFGLLGAKDMAQEKAYGVMNFELVLGYYFFKLLTFIMILILVIKTVLKMPTK